MDSVSTVDFEQIVLAMQKAPIIFYPQALQVWLTLLVLFGSTEIKPPVQKQVPFLPKLILSGSATSLTALQG